MRRTQLTAALRKPLAAGRHPGANSVGGVLTLISQAAAGDIPIRDYDLPTPEFLM